MGKCGRASVYGEVLQKVVRSSADDDDNNTFGHGDFMLLCEVMQAIYSKSTTEKYIPCIACAFLTCLTSARHRAGMQVEIQLAIPSVCNFLHPSHSLGEQHGITISSAKPVSRHISNIAPYTFLSDLIASMAETISRPICDVLECQNQSLCRRADMCCHGLDVDLDAGTRQ